MISRDDAHTARDKKKHLYSVLQIPTFISPCFSIISNINVMKQWSTLSQIFLSLYRSPSIAFLCCPCMNANERWFHNLVRVSVISSSVWAVRSYLRGQVKMLLTHPARRWAEQTGQGLPTIPGTKALRTKQRFRRYKSMFAKTWCLRERNASDSQRTLPDLPKCLVDFRYKYSMMSMMFRWNSRFLQHQHDSLSLSLFLDGRWK